MNNDDMDTVADEDEEFAFGICDTCNREITSERDGELCTTCGAHRTIDER